MVKTLKVGGFVYIENNLFTKNDILESFESYIKKIKQGNSFSANTKKEKIKLYEDFLREIKNHSLPDLTNGWYYKYTCSDYNIELSMCGGNSAYGMENAEYILIKKECKYLTVEEFAALRSVSDVTVRQWIRRGKLRYAKKIGGEWFIPETSENPGRGYSDVEYELLDNSIRIGEFPIASYCNSISIYQDDNKSQFICHFINRRTNFFRELVLSRKDVESLELALISSGKVRAKPIVKAESTAKIYDE